MYDKMDSESESGVGAKVVSFFSSLLSSFFSCFAKTETLAVAGVTYKVIKQIGEGGFSFVYKVSDPYGNLFAAKKLLIQNEEVFQNAQREIEVYTQVRGDYVLNLVGHDVIRHPSIASYRYVILIYPLFERGTLMDIVTMLKAVDQTMTEKQVLRIFQKVCIGLRAFHDHTPRLAHRDIKLDNVLLDYEDNPYLMDFGSAGPAVIKVKSRAQAMAVQEAAAEQCTCTYRAPELFDCPSKITIDQRTDVWSLGCLLYGMAFGESPFECNNVSGGSFALATISGKYDIPKDHEYSDEFIGLIRWMLNTNIKERPYVPEILERLETLL